MNMYILIFLLLFSQNVFSEEMETISMSSNLKIMATATEEVNCSISASKNVKKAFGIIEGKKSGLCQFLKNSPVSRTAYNAKCESMYHVAVRVHNQNSINCLNSKNYDVPAHNAYIIDKRLKISFLEYAFKYASLNFLKSYGFDLNGKDTNGVTSLVMAVRAGASTNKILHLVGKGVDIDAVINDSYTALMLASYNKSIRLVKILLQAGADVDLVTKNGLTALMSTVANPDPKVFEVLKTLLQAGADVDPVTESGVTALMLASRSLNLEVPKVLKILLRAGADVNATTNMSLSELIKIIIRINKGEKDIDIDNFGYTALMGAAKYHNSEAIKVLLQAGADVNLRMDNGKAALMFAVTEDSYSKAPKAEVLQSVKALLQAGADVNLRMDNGVTALVFVAGYSSSIEVCKALLLKGADIHHDPQGNIGSVLWHAARNPNKEVGVFLKHWAIEHPKK